MPADVRTRLLVDDRAGQERRRALRKTPGDVPWLSAVRMPWGLDLQLMNISSTGLLVESTSKLTPGISYDLILDGPSAVRTVKAQFVRSEVGKINGLGVRYYSAARFEQELDLLGRTDQPMSKAAATPQQALADLLSTVFAEHNTAEPARYRFARGLRKLVNARDVLVRKKPINPVDGSESIYFQVNEDGSAPAVLQVLFDRDRVLTPSEFSLLKAAASLTAAVLELEKTLLEA